jgi:hypothetical protein
VSKRNALEQAVGPVLANDWQKRVDDLAIRDWGAWLEGEDVPYEVALNRLRLLLEDGVLPEVPTEAVFNTCFGLSASLSKKARKEILLLDTPRRYRKLKKALQSPVKETEKFLGRKVHRYEIEDFLEADLNERSEKVEADFKRQRLPYKAPEKVRGHPRPGWDYWDVESRLVGGLLVIL